MMGLTCALRPPTLPPLGIGVPQDTVHTVHTVHIVHRRHVACSSYPADRRGPKQTGFPVPPAGVGEGSEGISGSSHRNSS
jgi:hypothetical protein